MPELIKVVDGVARAYSHEQFRGDYKTTGSADKHLNPHGVYRVFPASKPKPDVGYKVVPWGFPKEVEGRWTAGWDIVELNADEARAARNEMLKESDWMAVTDRTMAGLEAAYRQGLRDVPQQAGFPAEITWPTKPE